MILDYSWGLLCVRCDPNYSWDAPTLTLKLGPVPTIVGTIIKLGRNSLTHAQVMHCRSAGLRI